MFQPEPSYRAQLTPRTGADHFVRQVAEKRRYKLKLYLKMIFIANHCKWSMIVQTFD